MKNTKKTYSYPVTIANGANVSNVISFYNYAFAILHMPAAWTAADIAFQVSSELDGTFLPLYDESGAMVEVSNPAVDQSYSIPAEVLASRFARFWSQNAGVDANQGAARSLIIDMKA